MAKDSLRTLNIDSEGPGFSSNMELSIIIPSYNTRKLLVGCLESLYYCTSTLLQNRTEIIVVDNGSTDGTVANVKSTTQILKLIENKQNLGFAKAINQGLKEAKGEYLLLLNSDTVVLNSAIEKMVEYLKNHKEAGVVGCQLIKADGSIQPSGGYLPNLLNLAFWMLFLDDLPLVRKIFPAYHVEEKSFYTKKRKLGWVTGAFFLTRRDVLEKVGTFDEEMFMYVEEIDWCQRVQKAGFSVVFNPSAGVIHYQGASAKKGKAGILEEYQGLEYYFKKHKPYYQLFILKFLLRIGSLARIFIFGIILKDPEARRIYAKAYRLV